MIRKLTLSAALAVLTAGTVLAADLAPGTVLGTDHKAVAAALAAQGYDLVKFEQEHGRIEVKAMKNGQRWELKIDAKTGKITQVKADD
tara:strand:+ start:3395 stop:3658 length:264 start_codon:yes stop_codon:yes gene_type:complete